MLNWRSLRLELGRAAVPDLPDRLSAWGDTGNWAQGDWINGLRAVSPAACAQRADITWGLSDLPGPRHARLVGAHQAEVLTNDELLCASMAETRGQRYANPCFDIELTYEVLRSDPLHLELLGTIAGFFEEMSGKGDPFWIAPPGLRAVSQRNESSGIPESACS